MGFAFKRDGHGGSLLLFFKWLQSMDSDSVMLSARDGDFPLSDAKPDDGGNCLH